MLLSTLFPTSFSIANSTDFSNFFLLCLHVNEEIFFIHFSHDSFITHFINSISQIYPKTTYHIINDTKQDILVKEKIHIEFTHKNTFQTCTLSLEFLNFWKRNSLIQTPKTIQGFIKETLRFRPKLLDSSFWHSIPEKELSNLFTAMLSKNLVSTHMLAIFLIQINLSSPEKYFSTRIYKEISSEILSLQEIDPRIQELVLYIIEKNILILLQEQSIPALEFHYKELHCFQNFVFFSKAKEFDLSQLNFVKRHINTPHFYHLINQIPYHSLVNFLKISPNNSDLVKSGFSNKGKKKLEEDIQNSDLNKKSLRIFFEKIALIESEYIHESWSSLWEKTIHKNRDEEFLIREFSISDFFVILDFQKEKYYLKNMLQAMYYFYIKKQLLFPHKKFSDNTQSMLHLKSSILFLKLSGLIS